MRNITMNDVAKKAGVSLGTVSNVINDKPGVKEINRQKVLKAMEDLDYIPNKAAQSFKTRRSNTFGLIIPTITNPYYPAIAQGVAETSVRFGYQTILSHSERKYEADLRNLETLIGNRPAGIILVKPLLSEDEISRYAQHAPIVLIDRKADFTGNYDVIMTNNYQGSVDAVNHLYELGHRKIAYIAGDMTFLSSVLRIDGFLQAMSNHRLRAIAEIPDGSFSWEYGRQRAIELLQSSDRPTAIVCANDLIALGVYKAARSLNIRIPEELSVVGCDDIDLCQLVYPELTTVYQPKYEQGELAVRILVEQLEREQSRIRQGNTYLLPTRLIVRASTARVQN